MVENEKEIGSEKDWYLGRGGGWCKQESTLAYFY